MPVIVHPVLSSSIYVHQACVLAGAQRMAKDARWMTGKVLDTQELLPASADAGRSIKLVKLDISGNHVAYEPGGLQILCMEQKKSWRDQGIVHTKCNCFCVQVAG